MLHIARIVIPASLLLVMIACTPSEIDVDVETGTGALEPPSSLMNVGTGAEIEINDE